MLTLEERITALEVSQTRSANMRTAIIGELVSKFDTVLDAKAAYLVRKGMYDICCQTGRSIVAFVKWPFTKAKEAAAAAAPTQAAS